MTESTKKRQLVPTMLVKAKQIYDLLDPETVDIDFVKPYLDLMSESSSGIPDLTELARSGSKFLHAMDLCINASTVSAAMVEVGKNKLEMSESLARFQRSVDYFTKSNIKSTDKALDAYIDIDEDCIKEKERYNQWRALSSYFDKVRCSFENWHNWAKKLYDGDLRMVPNAGQNRTSV